MFGQLLFATQDIGALALLHRVCENLHRLGEEFIIISKLELSTFPKFARFAHLFKTPSDVETINFRSIKVVVLMNIVSLSFSQSFESLRMLRILAGYELDVCIVAAHLYCRHASIVGIDALLSFPVFQDTFMAVHFIASLCVNFGLAYVHTHSLIVEEVAFHTREALRAFQEGTVFFEVRVISCTAFRLRVFCVLCVLCAVIWVMC